MNDLTDIPKPDREVIPKYSDELRRAVESYALAEYPADWEPLAELSSDTLFVGLNVRPDTAIIQNGQRFAAGRAYVTLQYGDGSEVSRMEDSFPARIYFSLDKDGDPKIAIKRVEVDTSSFYD